MNDLLPPDSVKDRLRTLGLHLIAVIFDALFLTIWLSIQWIMNTFISPKLHVGPEDAWMFKVFQYTFGISTLAPIILYVIRDIGIMTRETFQDVTKPQDEP